MKGGKDSPISQQCIELGLFLDFSDVCIVFAVESQISLQISPNNFILVTLDFQLPKLVVPLKITGPLPVKSFSLPRVWAVGLGEARLSVQLKLFKGFVIRWFTRKVGLWGVYLWQQWFITPMLKLSERSRRWLCSLRTLVNIVFWLQLLRNSDRLVIWPGVTQRLLHMLLFTVEFSLRILPPRIKVHFCLVDPLKIPPFWLFVMHVIFLLR